MSNLDYQGEGVHHTDPTQSDDIYPPPPGFDHENDRYRHYDEADVERSVHKPKAEDRPSEMNDEKKRRASVTKRIWSALKVTFICACPLFIIGLILVILGLAKIPTNYDLTKPGAPILIIAMILLIVTILLLVVYKMRSMSTYDLEDKEMTGITNNGMTSSIPTSTNDASNKESANHGHQEDPKPNESRRI